MPAIIFASPITGVDNGRTYTQGYVQILHNGEWGSICDDRFDQNNNGANVVCKMMGYTYGIYSSAYKQVSIATARNAKMHLDNVVCQGSETSITQCTHSGWGNENCGHSEAVGVRCYRSGKFKQPHHIEFTYRQPG